MGRNRRQLTLVLLFFLLLATSYSNIFVLQPLNMIFAFPAPQQRRSSVCFTSWKGRS
jgi:uncharacterized PurR-regulated membrane protein YhhQ (DUF165 family)